MARKPRRTPDDFRAEMARRRQAAIDRQLDTVCADADFGKGSDTMTNRWELNDHLVGMIKRANEKSRPASHVHRRHPGHDAQRDSGPSTLRPLRGPIEEISPMVGESSARAFAQMHGESSAQVKAVLEKLVAAYEGANDDDRAQVQYLVDKAKTGVRSSEVIKLRPGAAAILFFDYNKQNREWHPSTTEDYAQQILNGEWEYHNQGMGFLDSGDMGDGQHRDAAVAVSGQTVELPVVFGMKQAAIVAIDVGRRRQAADFLGIGNQISEPKRKQGMVRSAFSTLRRLAPNEEAARPWTLRPGNRDMVKAMQKHDALLDEAMTIGDESVRGRSKPTFKAHEAAAFAFVLLLKGWPKARIIADLDTFQTGEDREGGNSPLFVASDQLQKDAAKREASSLTARFSAAIKAFVLHEQGVKAVRITEIRNAMKAKAEVDPSFPGSAHVHQLTA